MQAGHHRNLPRTISQVIFLSAALFCCTRSIAGSQTLYVQAQAANGGDGSMARPFNTLASIEQASGPGDTIMVLASANTAAPLDGGIALKAGQRLIGQGASADSSARIVNSSGKRNSGDAVELAPGVEVAGLMIDRAYRGGIYGDNVPGANVHDNDVSGYNSSCTLGLIIPTDIIPLNAPGVVINFPVPLPNGWAGIMLDADQGTGTVTVRNNTVHDAGCGDGIDLRLQQTAAYQADIDNNTVYGIRQGPILLGYLSVLAIGLQTRDTSNLTAALDGNTEYDIGSHNLTPEEADSEGIFPNVVDGSTLTATISNNSFYNGIGGFSANGLEIPVMGDGGTADISVDHSVFSTVPGDVIELFALGTNGHLKLSLSHVTASHSTGGAPLEVLAGIFASANNGDCLSVLSSGGGNSLQLDIADSELSDCYHDGLSISSNSQPGSAPTTLISFDIENSHIAGNQGDGLSILTLAPLTQLIGTVANSSFSANRGSNINLSGGSRTAAASLDFGGGAQGSAGNNCIFAGSAGEVRSDGYSAAMRSDWWGTPGGPGGGIVESGGAAISTAPVLESAPAACR